MTLDFSYALGDVFWGHLSRHSSIYPFLPYIPYFIGGVFFIVGICIAFVDERAFLSEGERRLKNVQIREIASLKAAPNGQAVKGRIGGEPCVIAPLSGTACLWYAVSIWEVSNQYSTRLPTRRRLLVREVEFSKHSYLEDDTGRCQISLRHTRVIKQATEIGSSGFLDPVTENKKKILEQYQISSSSSFGLFKKLHFKETVILPGESVVVSGRCVQTNEGGSGIKGFETDPSNPAAELVFVFGADYLPRNVRRVKYSITALCLGSGFFGVAAYIQIVPEWFFISFSMLVPILGSRLVANRDGE